MLNRPSSWPIYCRRYSVALLLGQRKVDGKSNLITAIPELLHLKGCIVTIDAMAAKEPSPSNGTPHGADYVLGLKQAPKFLILLAPEGYEFVTFKYMRVKMCAQRFRYSGLKAWWSWA